MTRQSENGMGIFHGVGMVSFVVLWACCLAQAETVFVETFEDGNRSLSRWEYIGGATPEIIPSPVDPTRNAFALDFRVTRQWRLRSPKDLALVAGGQYTLSAKMLARGPYSTVTTFVQNAKGGDIAQVVCPDTGGKSRTVSILFWAPPEPTTARMLVAGGGSGGEVWLEEVRLERNDPSLSTYPTGACIRWPSRGDPFSWVGVMIQAEDALADGAVATREDTDNDGRWALCRVPREDNPWMFTEATVLKSDSRSQEEGGATAPLGLVFRNLRAGKYQAYLNDPGRDAALSLDGKEWKRITGGKGEINLGTVEIAAGGSFPLRISHRFKTPNNPGPIYVDRVRFVPVYDAAKPPEMPSPLPPACKPVDRGEMTLTVHSGGQSPRTGEWILTGIPLPSGELSDGTRVAIDGVEGFYAKQIVRWPDGSAKWVRLAFRSGRQDATEKTYQVRYGASVPSAPTPPCPGRRILGGAELKLGHIEVKATDGLWDEIRYKERVVIGQGPGVVFACKPNTLLNQLAVEKISVEGEDSPCPALLIEGHLARDGAKGPIAFRARLRERTPTVLALAFSIMNEAKGEPKPGRLNACGFLQVTECRLSIGGINLSPKEVVWPMRSAPLDGGQGLLQIGVGECVAEAKRTWTLTDGGKPVATGERTDGWVDVRGEGQGLAVGVREFAERVPKSISVRRDGGSVSVEVGIWPGGQKEPFWFGQGAQITTELALVFHEGASPDERAGALASVFDPLRATLSPEDYCRSGVFWEVVPAAKSHWPGYEGAVEKAFETINRECTAYGIEDWGDAFVPGGSYVRGMTKMWINNEHDLCGALVSQFVRTGKMAYLQRADELARHFVNADIIHFHEQKAWIGGSYPHSPGVEVGHQVDTPNFGHAGWPQGVLWTYCLLGDESLREGVCGLADYVVTNLPGMSLYLLQEERRSGYPLVTLCSVYDLTHERKHLDAANRIVDFVLRCQDPQSGGWTRPIYETPPYHGSTPSFADVLCRGLDYYWGLTGDRRVEGALALASDWVAAMPGNALGYAEVAALSEKFSKNPKDLAARMRKEFAARFPDKADANSGGVSTNPRVFAAQVIMYNRLIGALEKAP